MCGIQVILGSVEQQQADDVLQRRGPDYSRVVQVSPTLAVQATVLHMRGPVLMPQPVKLNNDAVFCWNGEVYQTFQDNEKVQTLDKNASDTELIATMLNDALSEDSDMLQAIVKVLSRVWNAEYAFCVVTEIDVYYGRDAWGRRSLLMAQTGEEWRLSSVATGSFQWTEVPPGCVYQYNVASGETTSLALPKLRSLSNVPPPSCCTTSMPKPSHVSQSMWDASLRLQTVLAEAVKRRCCNYRKDEGVGVLFSGGLDSVVLAALAAQVLPPNLPIDLINVSFDTKSADRQAALQSHEELKALYPNRTFRLVLVQEEWAKVQEQHSRIEQLMHPKSTTMDLNISTALWFAARGQGVLPDEGNRPFHSTCRILLLGMGADEQMAGYGRHRKCAKEGGYECLRQELDMDMARLWERNLGRDDRLVSDHGKEARFPYLDTNVVNFLASLSLENICDFSQDVGDKQILRLIASRLGLQTASGLVKRAIQFGSRIAHISDKQRFGSRRKATGESHYKDQVSEGPV